MNNEPQLKDEVIEGMRGLVDQNLNKVEAEIDSRVKTAKESVRGIRSLAEKTADQALGRLRGSWEETQQKLEAQMARHPWLVLGAILVLGCLFSRSQPSGGRTQGAEPSEKF